MEDIAVDISLSIGIVKQINEMDVKVVIEKADQAMYHAKRNGGNQFYLFEE